MFTPQLQFRQRFYIYYSLVLEQKKEYLEQMMLFLNINLDKNMRKAQQF